MRLLNSKYYKFISVYWKAWGGMTEAIKTNSYQSLSTSTKIHFFLSRQYFLNDCRKFTFVIYFIYFISPGGKFYVKHNLINCIYIFYLLADIQVFYLTLSLLSASFLTEKLNHFSLKNASNLTHEFFMTILTRKFY